MDFLVEEWNSRIQTWMIDKKEVFAAGLAHISNGAVFAAACMEGDPVTQIYKRPYEASIVQEDGTEKTILIDETELIKLAATTLKSPNGLWIAGQKYKIIRSDGSFEQGKHIFKKVFGVKAQGGCYLIVTPGGLIVIALYEQKLGQKPTSTESAALAFGEYLADHGY